ncbi:GAF domain-containing protein [Motilibacter peucedani]|uniref:GAF domain-containing protein n=1 Tax=Motilibacter peucedani TaxID=598650 RepID=A0A420XU03_9ACTN|nr:GAF and ANTAR domain-containing protein [Motilibacter peucedani]RKS80221.1 GAF domain-containing protein [Motilibacter peucedani]
MTDRTWLPPADAFSEFARLDLRTESLQDVLAKVSRLATQTIPGTSEASVTLLEGDRGTTPAWSGELARDLDEAQYATGQGPCLAAAAGGELVLVPDLASDDRWPDYIPTAVARGARSSLSVALPVQETVTGALNLYATQPHAFDQESVALARTFAGYAAISVANAHLFASTATLCRQMESALASRAVIEQAKGLIVGQRRCTPQQAFEVLVRASSVSNRKLRDIAADLLDAAQQPR